MTTTAAEARAGHDQHGNHHGNRCQTVAIHVNNQHVVLQPGRYDVPTFKKVTGVPLADDLEELVNCKLRPVAEDGHIDIEGCEVFISHVRDGGAS